MRADNLLETTALTCVRGGRTLFRNLHCTVEAGSMLQICAHNGAGKTSLLRILCGLSRPQHGEVKWNGIPIHPRRADFARAVAYCGHQAPLNGALTAVENLEAARALWAHRPALSSRAALHQLALRDCLHRPCRLLSAGQRQRVALAAILAHGGDLWLLDEPAAALDRPARRLLAQMLAAQVAVGGMVIFTSHRKLMRPESQAQPQQLRLERFQ